jgi:ribonuclease D
MKIITTTEDLADVCADYAKVDFVTVDTEFLRESTFWPILCLIQLAREGDECIIDPLAEGIDLAPFYKLMADESVVKVFHAARQDIEIFVHQNGQVPTPIFDTQVAAMVCGYGDSVGYAQLAQKIAGANIDKSSRFTDWSRRPLSDKQLDYALADVTHLRDIYKSLRDDLARKKRSHWLDEEMAVLEAVETYDLPVEQAWTRLKMRVRKSRDLAVMQAVAEWREKEARSRDIPRGRILKDDGVYEVAQQHPKNETDLARFRAVPGGFAKSRHAKGLLDAVANALALPDDQLPHVPRPTRSPEGTGAATELLKVLLKVVCEENQVASKIIATADDLEKIAADDNADVAALTGWRRELFGAQALDLKRGDLALSFEDRRIAVVELE